MPKTIYAYTLVTIQFAALAVLAVTGPILAANAWWLVEALAVLLGLWAIVAMRIGNFNITPDPKHEGILVERGPYRWIRHPMYAALIMLAIALIGNHFSWLRLSIGIILAVDLLIKLSYEEQLLLSHFASYEDFRKRTWRLIPFVY